jgi:hypothetical protein
MIHLPATWTIENTRLVLSYVLTVAIVGYASYAARRAA